MKELSFVANPVKWAPDQRYARHIHYGECFLYDNKKFMRVKPTQFLLNSNLVADSLNSGKVFSVNLESGALNIIPGDREVKSLRIGFCEDRSLL